MSRPQLIATENTNLPVLIIDREGSIGLGLYAKLKEYMQIVLVGGREPDITHNLLFLHLHEHIPSIPKDQYSHLFLVIESEKDLTDLLPSCLSKAKEDKAKLLVIITASSFSEQEIQNTLTSYNEASIVLVRDMFGAPFLSKKHNNVEVLFREAKNKQAIKLEHIGLQKVYPVEYADVIIELLKIAFGGKHHSQVFYLFCRYPVTQLGLAHALQKVNPLIKIDFTNTGQEKEYSTIQGGVYVLPETYPLFDKLYTAYALYRGGTEDLAGDEGNKKDTESRGLEKKSDKSRFAKTKLFFILAAIFVVASILLPSVTTFIAGFQGRELLLSAQNQLQKGNSSSARTQAVNAENSFVFAQKTSQVVLWEANILGLQNKLFGIEDALQTGESLAITIERVASSVEIIKNVISGYSSHPDEDTRTVVSNFKQVLTASQSFVDDPNIPVTIRQELGKELSVTSIFANVVEGLPAFLSTNGKKTYAVLFQNNMELRPGGGFIGSYGLLTINKGKVTDFSIHDVYDADGQLRGHVEPPFQLRRYMALPHLYLRDSNFDVDFLKNASQVALLLQLETGQQIDGVVGIDLSFVKSIIQALGSVTVPDYTETVTPDNFFLLTESHAEKNFFPGSTQKKDFLRSLFAAIQEKITIGNISYPKLFSQAALAAKEKHILFAFADKPSQDLFTVNGLSATLWDPRTQQEGTINDFLGINEANLGVNKVNYYIDRTVDQRAAINDAGDISEQVTLTYSNRSNPAWPGGPYKNYLRFILPQNTTLVKVMIGGQDQKIVPAITDFKTYEAKNFVPPSGLEVDREEEEGKTLYGFLLTIPPQSKQTVTIIYVLPQKFNMSKITGNYSFSYLKQQGTDMYPYTFSLTYPSSMRALAVPPGFFNQGTQVVYSGSVTTDMTGIITLSKK